jgi:hypothetical protein
MSLTKTGRSPGITETASAGNIALTWPDLASVRGRPSNSRPMMGSEGPAVQAHSTWFTEQPAVRRHRIVTDLTVPGVRLGLARPLPAQRLADLVSLRIPATATPLPVDLRQRKCLWLATIAGQCHGRTSAGRLLHSARSAEAASQEHPLHVGAFGAPDGLETLEGLALVLKPEE